MVGISRMYQLVNLYLSTVFLYIHDHGVHSLCLYLYNNDDVLYEK